MKIMIGLLTLLIAACSGQRMQDSMRAAGGHVFKMRPSIERIEAPCAAVEFLDYGACVRGQLAIQYPKWRSDPEADLIDVYVAWLDAAGERVAAGSMSVADAKFGVAMLKSQWKSTVADRKSAKAAADQSRAAAALAGLAIMNSANPGPGSPIVCRSTPTGLGTVTTTCN